jgi:superfamily II DNA or RNA helicase
MSLTRRLAPYFSSAVRTRGDGYVAGGRVKIVRGSPTEVAAAVSGTRRYSVVVRAQGAKLTATCDCPYADNDLCKHVWATLHASERGGHLSAVATTRASLSLAALRDPFDDDIYEDDDIAEDDEGGEDDGAVPSPAPSARRGPPRHLHSVSAPGAMRTSPTATNSARKPDWSVLLADARAAARREEAGRAQWAESDLAYVIQSGDSTAGAQIRIEVFEKGRGPTAKWSPLTMPASAVAFLPREADRLALGLLGRNPSHQTVYGYSGSYERMALAKVDLPLATAAPVVLELLRTGRAYSGIGLDAATLLALPNAAPIMVDDGAFFEPRIEVDLGSRGGIEVRGSLARGEEKIDVVTPDFILPGGLAVVRGRAVRFKDDGAFGWINLLRAEGVVEAPAADVGVIVSELSACPASLVIKLAPELQFEEAAAVPKMRALFRSPLKAALEGGFRLEAFAEYDGVGVAFDSRARFAVDPLRRRLFHRDPDAESTARLLLSEIGARPVPPYELRGGKPEYKVAAGRFQAAVRALVAAGWRVEADGKPQRAATELRIEVTSGIDWFDVDAKATFGSASASVADLLAALRHARTTVLLDDGSVGIVPEEWLERWGVALSAGQVVEGQLRFRRGQAAMLDVLLAGRPEVYCDEAFAALRGEIARFSTIAPARAPAAFNGKLRDYQREGLGWMQFLRKLRFGGCLADDMGLGKTVQVLAMLLERKAELGRRATSLVVVPRSLIFNWRDEARRFAPDLAILEHGGIDRLKAGRHFDDYDIILMTYGTLRRDIHDLAGLEFDYVILDEATAIKSADSAAAKAARLLCASHRLAMTGTPIENHIGELWSLFEFLNPGMLGTATVFKKFTSARRDLDESARGLLSRALRPFILRRTKAEVAKELPARVEQTLHCDLESDERTFYDEIRSHVRSSLRSRVERAGIARSTVHILEGLLRLRQAACHAGLIDKSRSHESSAKLDLLFEQLARLEGDGGKAIVFSQFTSLLALVRRRLDADGMAYEYLDGSTRDRQAAVGRFQTDPKCRLFLISLKAGGLGLNLTAAQYVFLLDPWWNPAVEAQAIDRAHRIGQRKTVFAYRIIARDTVEEKVAELQQRKRALADSLLADSAGGLKGLTRADLEILLQ